MKKTAETLEKKVSVFKDIKDTDNCISVNLADWLNDCIAPKDSEYIDLVNRIRNEKDKAIRSKLKKILPAVTIAAEVSSRSAKVKDKIRSKTGLLCFDIDEADNTNQDMIEIRERLSNNRSVIFVGLSVSGRGVWGIIEVKYPEKLAEHFQQLKYDFKAHGINLDKSKGGNPTDLRFYSHDPNAYLSKEHKVYDRLPRIKPISRVKPKISTGIVLDPIQTSINMIYKSSDGEKHAVLLKASKLLGGYISAGCLGYSEAETRLREAIKSKDIVSMNIAEKTIKDGLEYGINEPVYLGKNFKSYNRPNIVKKTTIKSKLYSTIEYFVNLDTQKLEFDYLVDGVPIDQCLNDWLPSAAHGNKDAYSRLDALKMEICGLHDS